MGEGSVLQLVGPSTGGIRRVVEALVPALEHDGWSVRTVGPDMVPVGIGRALAARRALRPLLGGVDVVHAHGLTAGWIASTLPRRPPLVVTVHNLVLDEVAGRAGPLLRVLEGWLPSRSDRVIAVSDEIASRFRGARNVVVIPPVGAPPRPERSAAAVRAAYGVAPGERLLVTVARLHPQKDLPMLLDAVDRLRHEVPGVRLLVVGEGPEAAALQARATALDLDDVVTFTGPRPSAADELAAADVVCISSRWESGPLVLFEAMSLGRPVVTTAVGAAPEVATGPVVPVGDAAAFAAAVARVLADPGDVGERGRAAVAGRYDTSVMATATEAVYREVLR
jgi:glycosyltransferase involved in cell wall biosynthesis